MIRLMKFLVHRPQILFKITKHKSTIVQPSFLKRKFSKTLVPISRRTILGICGDSLKKSHLNTPLNTPFLNLQSSLLGKLYKNVERIYYNPISIHPLGGRAKFALPSSSTLRVLHKITRRRQYSDSYNKHIRSVNPKISASKKGIEQPCKKNKDPILCEPTKMKIQPKPCCPHGEPCLNEATCSQTEKIRASCIKPSQHQPILSNKLKTKSDKSQKKRKGPCNVDRADPCKPKKPPPKMIKKKVDPCQIPRGDPCKRGNCD